MREDLKTDRDGRFVIDGLDEGTINIVVFGEGEGVDWTYRAAQDVVLRSGETSDITIELIRGVEIEGKDRGRRLGRSGCGRAVGVYGPFRPRTGAMTRGATTDARGVYHYRLPPGETYFYVIGPPSGYTRLADDGSSRTVNIPTNGAIFRCRRSQSSGR